MIKKWIEFNRVLSSKLSRNRKSCTDIFRQKIHSNIRSSNKVLEIGGSSRPFLKRDPDKFNYWGLDVDHSKNYEGLYDEMFVGSIESFDENGFDLIFSKFLLEHVEDVRSMYETCFSKLNSGGNMVHVYPLGNHPFSIVTKIVQKTGLTKSLIRILRPEAEGTTGYYTYYNQGTSKQIEKILESLNGAEYEIYYTYEAEDYFGFFFPFALVMYFFNSFARKFNLTSLASNVVIKVKKGDNYEKSILQS